MATKPDNPRLELRIIQLNAIDLLALGMTDAEVAEAVGVSRQTVNGWRNHHPGFIAALNVRRREVWGTACDRLRALLPKAVDALEAAVTADPPNWRAASKVIEIAGLSRPFNDGSILGPELIGPATVEEVIDAEVLRRRGDPLADVLTGRAVSDRERGEVLRELSAKLGD